MSDPLRSSKAVALIGLQMMPTFPPPPLRFRRVGFPQYGSKASLSAEACPGGDEVKPTPGMPSARPEFASRLRDAGRYRIGTPPVPAPKGNPARSSLPAPPLTPGVLGSGRVLLSRPSSLIRPHAPVSGAPRDFTTLRRFYSGPSLGGRAGSDPRDLPYFPCRAVPTCRGPYAGRLAPHSRCPGGTITGFLALGPSRHPPPPPLPAIPDGVLAFDAASFALCCGPQVCLALLAGYDAGSQHRSRCLLRTLSPSLLAPCLTARG